MGRTVETGIVLTGKDQSASAVLSKTAAEASKLEKQVSNIGKGAAQASPSLAKFAGGLGLYGGAAFVGMRALQDAMRGVIEHVATLAPDLSELQTEVTGLDSALVGIAKQAQNGADTFEILVGAVVDYFSTAAAESERFRLQLEKKHETQRAYLDSVVRSAQREAEVERQAAAEQAELHKKVEDLKRRHEEEDKKRHEAFKKREQEAQQVREKAIAETIRRMEAKEKYEADVRQAQVANQNYIYDLERRISDGKTDLEMTNLQRVSDQRERDAENYQRQAELQQQMAVDIGAAFGQTFAAMATGQMSVEEGFKSMAVTGLQSILSTVQRAIMAYAAESAAAAYASQAAVPVVGPLLGAAAASAAFGLVSGFLGMYEDGGIVRGGIKGRDSVPIMAQDGERVLTVQQTRSFDRLVESISNSRGPMQPSRGGGHGIVININSEVPASRSQLDKAVRDSVLPATRRLTRLGYKVTG